MPIPLEVRTRWIEERLVDDFGRPIRVRPWMRDNLIKPLDGYQAWRAGARLCDPCKARVGRLRPSRAACTVPAHDDCDGVVGHKIIIVVVSVPRQEGKTTGFAGYSLSDIYLARNTSALYLAAAEDQAGRIFEQKWVSPIERNPKLKSKVHVGTNEISYAKKNNSFRFVPTSARSVPGGSYRRLYIDEARDVPEEVASKLIPSIMAAHGLECPNGHYTTDLPPAVEAGAELLVATCPTCSAPLEEWFGEVVVASSAGEDAGWFYELVELLMRDPDPGAWMFHTDKRLNPNKSDETVGVLDRTFGKLPSMKGLMAREIYNVFSRTGDEFLPAEAIAAITNASLRNVDTSDLRCVAFLDCSKTRDITSLVIAGETAKSAVISGKTVTIPFFRLSTIRIDVWDPGESGGRVKYSDIRARLVALFGGWLDLDDRERGVAPMPMRFPALVDFAIDVSQLSDAQELADWAQAQPWGGRVQIYQGGDSLLTSMVWDALEARAFGGRAVFEIQDLPQLKKEIRAAALKKNDKGIVKVVDSAHGNRRGGVHRDILMSVAGCCWLASKHQVVVVDHGRSAVMKLNESLELQRRFASSISTTITQRKW